MKVAFDRHNLDAAVTAVMEEAVRLEQESMFDTRARIVDLTDRDQVREHLKSCARAAYELAEASPDGVQIARIEDVPYRGIGFVFELHGDVKMHPAPEGSPDGEWVDHLALFWGNLSR